MRLSLPEGSTPGSIPGVAYHSLSRHFSRLESACLSYHVEKACFSGTRYQLIPAHFGAFKSLCSRAERRAFS
jgi:hypothetical protein